METIKTQTLKVGKTVYNVQQLEDGTILLQGARGAMYVLTGYAKAGMEGLYHAVSKRGLAPAPLRL
jgi:hypothetical protein